MLITTKNKKRAIEVGSSSFLLCFYSTISKRTSSPATNFPRAYELLKKGRLESIQCSQAAHEFNKIRDVLSQVSTDQVVWDISAPDKLPPWGKNISPTITSLGNYFLTADGKDLIFELVDLLQFASDNGEDVEIN